VNQSAGRPRPLREGGDARIARLGRDEQKPERLAAFERGLDLVRAGELSAGAVHRAAG
jgi:hypothetical protein